MAGHIFTRAEIINILEPIIGKTLGEVDVNNVFDKTITNPKIKGIAGDVIEQSVFGYRPDSDQEPDLLVDGAPVELKTTGIKKPSSRNKTDYEVEAKEPMSITAVSVDKIAKEADFFDSTLWHKLEELLLVYYLYNSDITVLPSEYRHFPIQGYQFHKFSEEDQKILEKDWKVVRDFVRNVEENRLNPKEEFPKISQLRSEMSFMDTAPKYPKAPRFRLTKRYLTTIVQEYFGKDFKPIYPSSRFSNLSELKQILVSLTNKYKGKSILEIATELEVPIEYAKHGKVSKSLSSIIIARMFSKEAKRIEDIGLFSKFGFKSKILVQTKEGKRTEDTKLGLVDFSEWTDTQIPFDSTSFYNYFAEQKFLFSIFCEESSDRYELNTFQGFKIITFDDDFISQYVKPIWNKVRELIINHTLTVKPVLKKDGTPRMNKNGTIQEETNFPKSKNNVIFLRGSGKDASVKPLEINGYRMYHQFFWIKGSYLLEMLNNTPFL